MRNSNTRGYAERKRLTQRKINKRIKISDDWRSDNGHGKGDNQYKGEEGRLKKFNLNCGCKMCKHYKHIGNSKERLSHRDRKMLVDKL